MYVAVSYSDSLLIFNLKLNNKVNKSLLKN